METSQILFAGKSAFMPGWWCYSATALRCSLARRPMRSVLCVSNFQRELKIIPVGEPGNFDHIEALAGGRVRDPRAPRGLDRKLELVARTERTIVDLISTRHSLRVEWYIVSLIVLEILLTIYQLWLQ
jgi:hypothetical protein